MKPVDTPARPGCGVAHQNGRRNPLLSRFAARAALVTFRQTFVRGSHGSKKLLPLGSGEAETGEARGRDGGIREELAEGQF
jgi:hypothetical protein